MITIASIRAAVAAHYGLRQADLTSPERTWRVSHPRQVAMYLGRRLTRMSFPQIGRRFGGRHHTTALHARRAVGARLRNDRQLQRDVRAIWKALDRGPRA